MGEVRVIGIPKVKDRAIQMLLKLVLDPFLEPMGDKHSFGFRPGRGCHQAVSFVANRVALKTRTGDMRLRTRQFGNLSANPTTSYFNTFWIIDADIKRCFDNISHKWLIENTTMPRGSEHSITNLLKDKRLNKDGTSTISESEKGIPQGGKRSPLLMNWTLEGLEELITKTAKGTTTASSPMKATHIPEDTRLYLEIIGKLKNLKGRDLLNKLIIRAGLWLVRYADDFIVGRNSNEYLVKILEPSKSFLSERGLERSEEKTNIFPW
jgi:RNA-directed DNA polymerase